MRHRHRDEVGRAVGQHPQCRAGQVVRRLGERAAVLEALIAGDERGALTEMAYHLARTALRVLTDCAPDYVPVAVPHAVALIERQPPATLRAAGAS